MLICNVSDLHGHLIDIPDCDLLLIAGDVTPLSVDRDFKKSIIWYNTIFNDWIQQLKARGIAIIMVAGNHDFIFEKGHDIIVPHLDCCYLNHNETTFKDLIIYGAPYSLPFNNWAFNVPEVELEKKWAQISNDTDIIIVHGPPYEYGDKCEDGRLMGSTSLTERIKSIKPSLVVTGHIHHSYGTYMLDATTIINASVCTEKYKPLNKPIMFEI